MRLKHSWIWKIYLLILLLFVIKDAYHLLMPNSQIFFYYFILRVFDPTFYAAYTAYVMRILLNTVHWIPVFLYVYRVRFLSVEFWKCLFILRCIFEIIGHTFEMNVLASIYHAKPKILLTAFIIFIIPHVPSYIACYGYAFRREKILS
jgi:hypothetical protein